MTGHDADAGQNDVRVAPTTAAAVKKRCQRCKLGLACLAASTAFVIGCGGDGLSRAPAQGNVSLDGTPLSAGSITFLPTGETKGPAVVATITNGHYELPRESGPIIGTNRVEIEAINHYGFDLDDEAAYVANVEKKTHRMPKNPVPPQYNEKSTLTAVVADDPQQHFDYQLTSTGK